MDSLFFASAMIGSRSGGVMQAQARVPDDRTVRPIRAGFGSHVYGLRHSCLHGWGPRTKGNHVAIDGTPKTGASCFRHHARLHIPKIQPPTTPRLRPKAHERTLSLLASAPSVTAEHSLNDTRHGHEIDPKAHTSFDATPPWALSLDTLLNHSRYSTKSHRL